MTAPCVAAGPTVFFDNHGRGAALRICATCDPHVRAACLSAELAVMRNLPARSSYGIRGGTGAREREEILIAERRLIATINPTVMRQRRADAHTEALRLRVELWHEQEGAA